MIILFVWFILMIERSEIMNEFFNMLVGSFDNKEQFELMQKQDKEFPYCKHINTLCNEKIIGLPKDFQGQFMLEESYYQTEKGNQTSPRLFLFVKNNDDIILTSYEMPDGYTKETLTYQNLTQINYQDLKVSTKFTPAVYKKNGDYYEGGSVSQFSPVLQFTLYEKFSTDCLEVSETMEVNGKRTFGYDEPILYKKIRD